MRTAEFVEEPPALAGIPACACHDRVGDHPGHNREPRIPGEDQSDAADKQDRAAFADPGGKLSRLSLRHPSKEIKDDAQEQQRCEKR